MIIYLFKSIFLPKKLLGNRKTIINIILIYFLYSLLLTAGIKVVQAQSEEQESTISATIIGPSATATVTATATAAAATGTAAASPTPTLKPGATPILTPTPIPLPMPPGIFKIFGYAPSNSQVFLTGIAVSEKTISQLDGYFEFNRLFFPTILSFLSGYKYPELCLFSIDDKQRITSPVCIPPLPLNATTNEVGAILLSPTLDIEKGILAANKQTKASGKTIPNTEVTVFLARAKSGKSFFRLIKEVLAYNIPLYQIQSDSKGEFEFNLPNEPDVWRLYAGAKILGSSTAKSNTLIFNVYSPFFRLILYIINYIKILLLFLRPYWIYLIILIQIVIIILLIKHIHKRRRKRQDKKN